MTSEREREKESNYQIWVFIGFNDVGGQLNAIKALQNYDLHKCYPV